MKRKIKRRLKEDELVTTVGKVVGFTRKRSKEIISGALVLALAILIFVGVRFVKAQNIRKESKMLGQILTLYTDLETKPENMERLEEVAGKGKFSRLAYILLANHWIENEDFSKAEELVKQCEHVAKEAWANYRSNLVIRGMANAQQVISEAKESGVDVTDAQELLSQGASKLEENDFDAAEELINKAETLALEKSEGVRKEQAEEKLENLRNVYIELEGTSQPTEELKKLIDKKGKKQTFMIILLTGIIVLPLSLIGLIPGEINFIITIIWVLAIAAFMGGWYLFPYIWLADLAEDAEVRSGEGRKSGLYAGFPQILLNIFQAIALFITGLILSLPNVPGKDYSWGYILWGVWCSGVLIVAYLFTRKLITLDFEWENK